MDRESARGRRRSRSLVVVFLALAVVTVFGIAAQQALALPSYVHDGATACTACHNGAPAKGNVTNAKCITCHTGYAVINSSKTCWTCHTPGQDMAPVKSGAPADCTVACHLASGDTSTHVAHTDRPTTCTVCHPLTTSPTIANGSPHHTAKTLAKTTVSLKVAPASIKLRKTVTAAGIVTPVSLVGEPVTLTAQLKSGAKWVKSKAAAVEVTSVGATAAYSWTYKPLKKGVYRMQAAVKATSDYAGSSSKWVTFRVK